MKRQSTNAVFESLFPPFTFKSQTIPKVLFIVWVKFIDIYRIKH